MPDGVAGTGMNMFRDTYSVTGTTGAFDGRLGARRRLTAALLDSTSFSSPRRQSSSLVATGFFGLREALGLETLKGDALFFGPRFRAFVADV